MRIDSPLDVALKPVPKFRFRQHTGGEYAAQDTAIVLTNGRKFFINYSAWLYYVFMLDAEVAETHRKVTIYDVAEAAHVAASTVSRALNRPERVNAEMVRHIREQAQALGYVGKDYPQALKARTHRIGLMANPRNANLVAAVVAQARGSELNVELLSLETQKFDSYCADLDGIIAFDPLLKGRLRLELPAKYPLVIINQTMDATACVVPDIHRGITETLSHLKALRHRTIAYLHGNKTWLNQELLESISAVCEALRLDLRIIEIPDNTLRAGGRAADKWNSTRNSAVISCGAVAGIGFMREVREHLHLQIPQDVSVLAIGDLLEGSLSTPTLTTLEVPMTAMGVEAVKRLRAQIRNPAKAVRPIVRMPMTFFNRDSTGMCR